jgi:Pro-kumamolisin, activation domain
MPFIPGAFMRFAKSIFPVLLMASFLSTASYAAVVDRITREIDPSQTVAVRGNVHGLARPDSDLGRADAGKMMHGVTLVFHPSAAQQQDLDNLLAEQQDRSSPNYHKWLTPAQFADRFGMSRADLQRVKSWLQSQGFAVTSVANSRNEISFDGTVSQIEVTFKTEIHTYLVNDEIHIANSTDPSVPAAFADSIVAVGHLHDFAPKPRATARPHLTSFVTGNHFVSPADFATIYNVAPLYSTADGTGQTIAIVGQSSVSSADLANFRSAAGLAPNPPLMIPLPNTTSTRCAGDEGESDLDLEWSGGVAKNATILFVYAGLSSGDTCSARNGTNVWDALDYVVQNNVAAFVSTSYGFCESGVGSSFADQVRGWAQQANTQGQTIVAATGDSGAADCDGAVASATKGLAVDVPASIPEVTGMGGNEFSGDSTTNTPPGADPPYWAPAGATTDTVSTALKYIPEMAWNDTAAAGTLSASGGGASIFFTKAEAPWQTGTGVPNDGKRDVPDLSLAASPDHDGYLVCSEDGSNGAIQSSCVAGFRDAVGSNASFTVVGGTSVAAPTFSAILALINQQLGGSGFGNVNPNLYTFAASSSSPFHDVTTGNNMVPCTSGTPNCPAGTTQYGFSAGTGYDQVTGLGSVDADKLATAWAATVAPSFTSTASPVSYQILPGAGADATFDVTFASGFSGTINFTCTVASSTVQLTCAPPPAISASGQVTAHVTSTSATPLGTYVLLLTGTSGSKSASTRAAVAVTQPLTLTPTAASFQVTQGAAIDATVNVAFGNGFTGTVTFKCTEPTTLLAAPCTPPPAVNASGAVSFHIATTAPTVALQPSDPGTRIFYASLLPGFLGIVVAGSRPSRRGMRLLGFIVVLGFSVLWLGSCGGTASKSNSSNTGTPVGTYTITVSGTSGTTSSSATFQLVVQ